MHETWLRRAIELACQNVKNGTGGPFAAIIVRHEQIIATETNRVTSNLDPTAHAEILAIRSACLALHDFQLKGCVLYTNCEPCPMCLGAIYWARLDAVFYAVGRDNAAATGFDDNLIYQEITLTPDQRRIPMHRINIGQSQDPFLLWQQNPGKILY